MADRKSQQKYYPPDWRPEHGSLNTYHGSHPLRERARKLHEGIVIVRFELPFNIWCAGCGNHAGMGVRYNAEKTQVGKYYTTPIFRFRMKCTMCENRFEIETDPKNFDYKIVCGASRQNHTPTPEEGDMHSLPGQSEAERLVKDPMYRLEHGVKDKQKAKESVPQIEQLQKLQEGKKDDFALNQMLRKKFRDVKKEASKVEEEKQGFAGRLGLYIPAVKEDEEDVSTAKKMKFGQDHPNPLKLRERKVKTQAILQTSSTDKKRREGLFKLQSKLDSRIFAHPMTKTGNTSGGGRTSGEGSGVSELRNKLGLVSKSKQLVHSQST